MTDLGKLILGISVMMLLILQGSCHQDGKQQVTERTSSEQGTCSDDSCKDAEKTANSNHRMNKEIKKDKEKQGSPQDHVEIPRSSYRISWDHNWDRKYPKKETIKPNATRTILIVRHGQFRLVHVEKDKTKPVLTDLGRVQAKLTGKRLKAMNIPISNVYYSATVSAAETADQICKIITCKNKEATKALSEGAPPIEPVPPVQYWKPSKKAMLADGIRMEGSFRKYFYRAHAKQTHHSIDLIISHANAIRYLICRSLQLPMEAWLRFNIANCGITTLTIEPDGRVTLMGLGDIGHLPPELITFT